jgi:hypothetical protein
MQSNEELRALHVGDRVRLSGGYDMEPNWLHGQSSYLGILTGFIPGQSDTPAAVVKLDESITVIELTGNILVLELRYVGAEWRTRATVHVELCDFIPEPKSWKYRRQGKWVESHATCMLVAPGIPATNRFEANRC